ncbi:uncharacterized protein LOC118749095 [Rhagoletis pomonella]|uniref:uncharacterized protein LOC118749095 n=1 Tax=Rhagoletis pomonella TaxID=28610 RepID=UPI001784CEA9|nr:uncharacterized protein LOC118749095 [Rhagoletis pomonella]
MLQISFDFELRYVENSQNLLQNWINYSVFAKEVYHEASGVVDPINNGWSSEVQTFLYFLKLLPFTTTATKCSLAKRVSYKVSESNFITFANHYSPIEEIAAATSHPSILAVGPPNKLAILNIFWPLMVRS